MKNRIKILADIIQVNLLFILILSTQALYSQIQQNSSPGSIYERDTVTIPYEEIELNCLCVPKDKYVIIRSFKQLLDLTKNTPDPECENFSPTEFDFNKNVIIGFYIILEKIGDQEPFFISIKNIQSENKYICEITVIQPEGISTLIPLPLRKTIIFPIHSIDSNIELIIVDYKNKIEQSTKNCYEHF